LSTIRSDSTPVESECISRDGESGEDGRKYNEYDEDDNYNDNDDGVMDPNFAEHMKAFMAQNTANIVYNV